MPRKGLRSRAFAAALLLCTSLADCTVGPDYHAPSVALDNFPGAAAVSARKAEVVAPPLDRWWLGFHEPELTKIVQRALDQNLDFAASLARVQQSRAVAQEAGAALLPTMDLTAQGTVQHQSVESPVGKIARGFPGYNRDQRIYDVGAAASWEIDLFGGLRRDQNAAKAEFQVAEADRLGTRISVAADAADAYFQIRGYQNRIAITRRQVDVNDHLLRLVKLQFGSGLASDREVARTEALVTQARANLPPLKIALDAQINRLDVLMGAQPGTYAGELAVVTAIPALPAIGDETRPVDVLRRRPDIAAAERRLAAANERIGAAISDYYPKISLSGALGFDSLGSTHLFTPSAFEPIGSGALRWRLFDFGKIDAEVAQARGADAEALAHYRQTVLEAAEDVDDAFTSLTQTEAHADDLRDEVAALTRARDMSQQSYRSGAIALTDVLDADRQLLTAQDELAASRADSARAVVRTFRAIGGGWST